MGILYTIFREHNVRKTFKNLYKKVFVRHRVLIKIIFNRDKKFILKF
jgi:hypothetical protein